MTTRCGKIYNVDVKYFTDGFTKLRNPSPVGGGYTIVDENNTVITVENIDKVGMTNNEAELLGVWHCLNICDEFDTISTDSMNTISWVRTNKAKKVKRQDLLPFIFECQKLIEEKIINLIWEGREHNLAGIYNETNHLDTCIIPSWKR